MRPDPESPRRVGFTISLISFISYSSQIFIIWPWYGRELSIPLLVLLVPFKYVTFPYIFLRRLTVPQHLRWYDILELYLDGPHGSR